MKETGRALRRVTMWQVILAREIQEAFPWETLTDLRSLGNTGGPGQTGKGETARQEREHIRASII